MDTNANGVLKPLPEVQMATEIFMVIETAAQITSNDLDVLTQQRRNIMDFLPATKNKQKHTTELRPNHHPLP